MSTESWDARLDRFAACLADQRAALEDGRPEDVRPFVPGTVHEPLPVRLADRGRRLQAEAQALENDILSALDDVGRQLQLLTALNRYAEEPRVRMLDCSA